jgi:hypothetical protein
MSLVQKGRIGDLGTIVLVAVGVAAHVWAGTIDMGYPVFSPVGPAAVLPAVIWAALALFSTVRLTLTRGRSRLAAGSVAVAVVGLALLLLG